MAHLSMCGAICGNNSLIWMPGTLVGMRRKGPDIQRGARLGIERFQMARTAAEEDEDAGRLAIARCARVRAGLGGAVPRVGKR